MSGDFTSFLLYLYKGFLVSTSLRLQMGTQDGEIDETLVSILVSRKGFSSSQAPALSYHRYLCTYPRFLGRGLKP